MSRPKRESAAAAALRRAAAWVAPALGIGAAALLGTAVIIAAFGVSPLKALGALAHGAVGSATGLTESTLEAIPLILTGLGVAIAFQCHLWNIGAEGQLLVGELAAIAVGTHAAGWASTVLLCTILIAGAAAGAVWAGIAAVLRVFRGVPEVISTILLNFVALYLVSWATAGPLKEPGQDIPRTVLLPEAARLPSLGEGGVHAGLILALISVIALGMLLYRTLGGFQIRAVGLNPAAAAAAGMPVRRTMLLAFALSGALAGLAGAVQLTGVTHRLYGGSSPGIGYAAIAVALVGGLRPIGALLAALLFGGLTAGSNEMQRAAGVSSVIALVIQGLVLLLLIARGEAPAGVGQEAERGKLTTGGPERS